MIDETVAAVLDAFQAVLVDATADGDYPADAVRCRRCGGVIVRSPEDDVLTLADLAQMCAFHQCEVKQIRMLTIAQAAEQAELDADHVRRWCISGQVQALKVRGRWMIVEESLLARLTVLDDLIDVLVGAGGNLWRKEGTVRVYFNEFWGWAGLGFGEPKDERAGRAVLDGKPITISTKQMWLRGRITSVHVDLFENALVIQHYGNIKSVAYTDAKDKARTLHLLGRLCTGFTKATGLTLGDPVPMQEYHRAGTLVPILPAAEEDGQ